MTLFGHHSCTTGRDTNTKQIADGMDGQGYRFVDQLDLDGDGTDEIVVEVTGYE
ncbi:MAG TPA: hypothetical protein VJN92_15230 [Candidatus Acidoferrum sp.]|nr:hypothetical protein [Candidatus Acidoferrum sp.]